MRLLESLSFSCVFLLRWICTFWPSIIVSQHIFRKLVRIFVDAGLIRCYVNWLAKFVSSGIYFKSLFWIFIGLVWCVFYRIFNEFQICYIIPARAAFDAKLSKILLVSVAYAYFEQVFWFRLIRLVYFLRFACCGTCIWDNFNKWIFLRIFANYHAHLLGELNFNLTSFDNESIMSFSLLSVDIKRAKLIYMIWWVPEFCWTLRSCACLRDP